MAELAMSPAVLAEMIALIEDSTISGKIAKQILPALLKVRLAPCGVAAWAAGLNKHSPCLQANVLHGIDTGSVLGSG